MGPGLVFPSGPICGPFIGPRIPGGLTPPSAPSNATAADNRSSIDVTWTDNSSNETSFEVWVSVDSGTYTLAATKAAGSTSHSYTPVTIGSTYAFKIYAINAAGPSAPSTSNTVTHIYHYGYPAFGANESNVTFQLKLDEASGNLTDTVGAASCVKVGSPTYSVTAAGVFAGVSPGITTSATAGFSRTALAALDPGTGSAKIEMWVKTTVAAGTNYLFSGYDGTNKGYEFAYLPASGKFSLYIEATDGTLINPTFYAPTFFNDGTLHKVEIVFDRAGNADVLIDNITLILATNSNAMSGLSGKTIKWGDGHILMSNSGTNGFAGTCFEFRFSQNATNDSGGPTHTYSEVTELFQFTMASGDLTGSLGDIFTANGASLTYSVAGNARNGVANSLTSYFSKAAFISALNPGTQNMIIRIRTKPTAAAGFQFFFDMGTGDDGSHEGYGCSFDATYLYCTFFDHALTKHYTRASIGTSFYNSGTEHEIIWLVDRSTAKCELFYDGNLSTTEKGTGMPDLSTLGAVNNAGPCRFFCDAILNGSNYVGVLYNVDIAINTLDPNVFVTR